MLMLFFLIVSWVLFVWSVLVVVLSGILFVTYEGSVQQKLDEIVRKRAPDYSCRMEAFVCLITGAFLGAYYFS